MLEFLKTGNFHSNGTCVFIISWPSTSPFNIIGEQNFYTTLKIKKSD